MGQGHAERGPVNSRLIPGTSLARTQSAPTASFDNLGDHASEANAQKSWLAWTRDNKVVYVPRAFVHQDQFRTEVKRVKEGLAPQVVDIIATLGDDWSGEPAVFFMVILADPATRRDQLLDVTNRVSQTLVDQVQPLEEWGVLPYFNFRSKSEQAMINEPTVA